jgi:hypothetical protein
LPPPAASWPPQPGLAPRAAGPTALSAYRDGSTSTHPSPRGGISFAVAWAASDDEGRTDLYVATSRDSGATFTPLQRINDTPGDVRVGGEQPPRVAVVAWQGGVRELHVVWALVRGGREVLLEAAASDLPFFGSGRFGRRAHSFFRQGIIKATDRTGRRLWPPIAEDSGHVMHVAWRDERGPSPQDSEVVAGRFDATEPVVVAHPIAAAR